MDQQTANQLPAIDPYARALGSAGIGSNISGNLTSALGNTWQGAMQMAGNVASFNANMLDSRANSYMNNRAAMNAARMQSGAMNRAGNMALLGSAIQGGMQAGGMIGLGQFGLGRSLMK